jgi:hypothetical protein
MNFEEFKQRMSEETPMEYMVHKLMGKLKELMPEEEYRAFINETLDDSIRRAMSKIDDPVKRWLLEMMLSALKEREESRKERKDG